MHAKGHFGLSLLVLSLIFLPLGFGPDYIVVIIIMLSAGLSSLPDIDLNFEIAHRGFTHNILFAIIAGIAFGLIFGYASGLTWGAIGFLAGFLGVALHLLGDMMTMMAFKPLWPFSHREIALCWFYADSRAANEGFMSLGIFMFIIYIMVSSGALQSLLGG